MTVKTVGSDRKYSDMCDRISALALKHQKQQQRRAKQTNTRKQKAPEDGESLHSSPLQDSETEAEYYISQDERCYDVPSVTCSELTCDVTVKANKHKHKVTLQTDWSGEEILKKVSSQTRIPLDRMKLIHKGRVMSADSIIAHVKNKALFQALGEACADESGLNVSDIGVIMERMSVERNEAVCALRQHSNVLDAMLFLGSTK